MTHREDGRLCLTSHAAERGLRAFVLHRRLVTAKLNDVDPQVWLAHVLANMAQPPANPLDALLPWNFRRRAVKLAA